jgi:protein-tyrosine phosphatase
MTAAEPAQRLPSVAGARNFRDLGGYPTADGQFTRWGRVYRSGALTYLTDAGRTQLAALGVRTVCDFRSAAERRREPSGSVAGNVEFLHWDYDFASVSLRGMLREVAAPSAEDMRQSITKLYRRLPSLFAEPYAAMFGQLARGNMPLVFHCAAGKDRTGLAAALLLTSLGVPHRLVLEDYALTNTAIDLEATLFQHRGTSIGVGDEQAHLSTVSRDVRAPLLEARTEYLQSAFDQIQHDHGSIDGYLTGALRVTADMRKALRSHLLEPYA